MYAITVCGLYLLKLRFYLLSHLYIYLPEHWYIFLAAVVVNIPLCLNISADCPAKNATNTKHKLGNAEKIPFCIDKNNTSTLRKPYSVLTRKNRNIRYIPSGIFSIFEQVIRYNLVSGSLRLINSKAVYEKRKLLQPRLTQVIQVIKYISKVSTGSLKDI